jgi:hypothetical protein
MDMGMRSEATAVEKAADAQAVVVVVDQVPDRQLQRGRLAGGVHPGRVGGDETHQPPQAVGTFGAEIGLAVDQLVATHRLLAEREALAQLDTVGDQRLGIERPGPREAAPEAPGSAAVHRPRDRTALPVGPAAEPHVGSARGHRAQQRQTEDDAAGGGAGEVPHPAEDGHAHGLAGVVATNRHRYRRPPLERRRRAPLRAWARM